MNNRIVVLSLICASLVGCAGKLDYIRPEGTAKVANEKIIDRSREQVWSAAVPELGKQYFVINNMDKSSGLINVSYSGDPERYINCGRIISFVSNARGERTHDFPAATASRQFEVMTNGHLIFVSRKMELEGRVNLIFEEVSPSKTKVTANTRYAVKRSSTSQDAAGGTAFSNSDSIAFNTGTSGAFPPAGDGRATECISTGRLEQDILDTIK